MGASLSVAQTEVSFLKRQDVQVAATAFIASAVAYKVIKKLISNEKPKPPGPWGFPIVGHLPLLGKEPNVTFMKMRERFGDVFQIRMGSWDTVVVNGKKAIRDVLVKKDEDFAGRPMFETSKKLTNGENLAFGRYDELYKVHRKLVAKLLTDFSNARKSPIEDMIHDEVDALVNAFQSHSGKSFDPKPHVYLSISSIIYQVCYGRHDNIRENEDFHYFLKNTGEFSKFVSTGNPVDVMPWLKYLMPWKMSKFVELIDVGVELRKKKVEEHRQTFSKDYIRDITDGLIAVQKDGTKVHGERLWSSIDVVFGAGLETVAVTTIWMVLLMAAHPEVQKRVQKELDEVVGNSRLPAIQDRENLVYTEAVLHEVTRFASPVAVNLPHFTTKDTELCGYRIKKDTVILANLYSMTHDKDVWGDPEVFRPERFLDDSGQINKKLLEEFLPFSAGTRKCLGEYLARLELFLFVTGILQRCSIVKPPEVKEYSMEATMGLDRRCLPYEVQVKPRY